MGHDDFDDMPPPDEEADDFKNFDPESYMRKRGRATGFTPLDDQTDEAQQDFDKFDPETYLRKRRAERGSREFGSASYPPDADVPLRGRRRRSRITDDDEPLPEMGAAAGLGAGILGFLRDGEGTRLNLEILREASPWIKAGLLALGCAILVVLGGICVLGFLLASAITRR